MNKKIIVLVAILGLGMGTYLALNKTETRPASIPNHDMHNGMRYTDTLTHYFTLQTALAEDNFEQAQLAAQKLATALGEGSPVTPLAQQIHHSESIFEARRFFEPLSEKLEQLVLKNGSPEGMSIGKYHCPMANNDKGASWLQNTQGVLNPYYGAEMLHCGTRIESLNTVKKTQ